MANPRVMQPSDDYNCFAVFDSTTKQLLYSKYNFNFVSYGTDFSCSNLSQNQMFYNFLNRNETDLWKPFSVKSELTQYFTPMTPEIQNYFDDYNYALEGFNFRGLGTYAKWNDIMENEFNLYSYDYFTEIPNVCEFLHNDSSGNIYSKYNFNFDAYSANFNVHGSKLSIFNDLLIRLLFLSGNVIGFIGTKTIPAPFNSYFYLDNTSKATLKQYLDNYSVFSCYETVTSSPQNIDYTLYSSLINTKYNINFSNTTEAKKYFLKYGQFQQDEIKFLASIDDEITNLSKSVCQVISTKAIGSGILVNGSNQYEYYNGAKQIYLVTCYHLIEHSNKDVLYATCFYNETQNLKLMFKIIGYDKHSDLCIAMYDDTLDYNSTNFPESQYNIRNTLNVLKIYSGDVKQYLGQQILSIGNPGLYDNMTYCEGKIMDANYFGNFYSDFVLAYPPTILSSIHISVGQSGSPLFLRDSKDNLLKCIGMVNAKTGDEYQYTIGISSHLFMKTIENGIAYWFSALKKFGNNIEKIKFSTQDIMPKKWLGAVCSYYNPATAKNINAAFLNFKLNIGLIITKFILGFNTITKQFIYEYDDLTEQGVIKINTPLLDTKMYNRFLNNNKIPIVIKSMKMYDLINGVYKTFNLGKYHNQNSFDILTYGFVQSATIENDTKYTNLYKREFDGIVFEYYYYNGVNWDVDTETVGGNTSEWFNEYTDSYGHLFLQHKYEYPIILIPYLETFTKEAKIIDAMRSRKCAVQRAYSRIDTINQQKISAAPALAKDLAIKSQLLAMKLGAPVESSQSASMSPYSPYDSRN
jgi:hypothetical protein